MQPTVPTQSPMTGIVSGAYRVTDHTMVSEKRTVSMPAELHQIITNQVESDINDSFSEWLQEAAYVRLSMQELATEARGCGEVDRVIEETDMDHADLGLKGPEYR